MKKTLIAGGVLLAIPLVLAVCLIAFVAVMALFNGRVEAPTDFSTSAMLTNPPASLTKPVTLKIATFNIQDLWVVGKHRPERMRAIGRVLTELNPDLVGFQEAFAAEDHQVLENALLDSHLLYSQYFRSATIGSGLLIMSAFPIKEAWFHRYTVANPWYKLWEGDWWAGKGAGLVRVELPTGAGFVDFYDTHAQADYGNPEYEIVRQHQMEELAQFINATRTGTAVTFLTGDMNCRPGDPDYEAAVSGAKLRRVMNLDTAIDHIFTVNDPKYTVEVLETVPISQQVQANGQTFGLSDHTGYMTTIRITPVP